MDPLSLSHSLYHEAFSRNDQVAGVRAYVRKSRELLLQLHRHGAGGGEIVAAYTTLVDFLLCRIFEFTSDQYRDQSNGALPLCALVAQGGYGRRELNPHSDIDLLFLYSSKVSPYLKAVTERILYTLWDGGLEVGHAVRTVSESIRQASRDMKIKTSLLDVRYLCGDRELFEGFEKAVQAYLVRRNGERFVREKLQETRERHEQYGGSVYLLEPDVKEGEGGLRDIHTAHWIAKVRCQAQGLKELVDKEILTLQELNKLTEARDFLWRVRNELHFSSGKHQDQLTFEEQERVAPALGYKDEGKMKAVEAFMRSYYMQASEVARLSQLVLNRVLDPTSGGTPWRARFWGREIQPGVRLYKGILSVTDPKAITEQPGNLIGIFHQAQKHNADIDYRTRELVREHTGLIDDRLRRSAAANIPFFEILKWKDRVYETLREMHGCGVLGAFIPEFGRLLCMALHDLYHIYTVDQHSLRLIRELERLKAGEFKDAFPLLTQLAREVETIEVLFLGLLFHDVGKGLGGGHSEVGAEIARAVARRMRLNVDDTAQLEFLVRYHLLFASTAFRRDLEDEKTISDFAATMGSAAKLKMLYLLTYCDMRSVGPDVWNNWKGSLLEELYVKTLEVLERQEKGESRIEDRRSRVRRLQGRLRRQLRQYPRDRVEHFFESMPERYFLSTPEDEIPPHFELMEQFVDQTYLCALRHFPELDCSKIAVCTRDRPGLFASITGVFAALGMDILSARIATRRDGLILDVFRISHGGRPEVMMQERRWERVRELLEQVLSGATDVAGLVQESGRPSLLQKRAPRVPTSVQIDNEASEDFTVVEVYTQDRIGILFTIAHNLHQLGLSIHIAKISTNVDQVADIFYVTDEGGGKVRDQERLDRIRQTLVFALVSQDEYPAQPAN